MDAVKYVFGINVFMLSIFIETMFCLAEFQSLIAKENLKARNSIMHDLKIKPIHDTRSPVDCTRLCLQTPECVSFFHHKIGEKCQLHTVVFANTAFWIPENGWRYYQAYLDKCSPKEGYIYNRALNMCYKYYTAPDNRDIEGAKKRCQEDNAELTRVNSYQKQTHLEDYLGSSGFLYDEVYIQGSYDMSKGLWVYNDGTKINYTNWAYPVNTLTGTKYITINKYDHYKWKQVIGSESRSFICEKAI